MSEAMYIGQYLNEHKNGKGFIRYKTNEIYTGLFKEGKKNGYGVHIYEDKSIYIGNWKDDLRHGKGSIIYTNGNEYDGNWVDNEQNGYGKIKFSDGSIYEGDILNSVINGQGIFTNGTFKYRGSFQNGKKDGGGKIIFINNDKYKSYEGNWIEDKRPNIGTLVYTDNSSYEGMFKENCEEFIRHGNGIFTDNNNKIFSGSWVDDAFINGHVDNKKNKKRKIINNNEETDKNNDLPEYDKDSNVDNNEINDVLLKLPNDKNDDMFVGCNYIKGEYKHRITCNERDAKRFSNIFMDSINSEKSNMHLNAGDYYWFKKSTYDYLISLNDPFHKEWGNPLNNSFSSINRGLKRTILEEEHNLIVNKNTKIGDSVIDLSI